MNADVIDIFNKVESELLQTNPFDDLNGFDSSSIDKECLNEILNKQTSQASPADILRLQNEFFSMGPLHKLISNDDITEILINGPKAIYYEQNGKLIKHNDYFFSDQTYKNFIERFCSENNCPINLQKPNAFGNWSDFRFHIISPPLCPKYCCLSLRRHKKDYWDFAQLKQLNWADDIAFECLKHLVQSGSNLLIIGPTGTGKTTIVNCLLKCIDNDERVITIEDTSEIQLPNDVSLKLLTRTSFDNPELISFEQSDLLKESLRLRPDRIVVGEIRGKEAKDYLLALSTGHSGSMSTLHAKTAKEALWRLEILTQMGAPEWSLHTIRGIIGTGINYVIELNQGHSNRSLKSIKKLTGVDGSNYLLEEIWPNKLSF